MCVHTGVWHTNCESAQRGVFYSEKLSQIFLVLLTQAGFAPPIFWISNPTLYQLSHPVPIFTKPQPNSHPLFMTHFTFHGWRDLREMVEKVLSSLQCVHTPIIMFYTITVIRASKCTSLYSVGMHTPICFTVIRVSKCTYLYSVGVHTPIFSHKSQ